MGNSSRVKQTKKLLHDALLRELEESSLGEIVVSRLCEDAGVNRSTFYRYYRTPYDVFEEMEKAALEEFHDDVYNPQASQRENIISVLRYLDAHRLMNLALNELHIMAAMNGHIIQKDNDFIRCAIIDRMTGEQRMYFNSIVIAIIHHWLKKTPREPAERIADMLLKLADAMPEV